MTSDRPEDEALAPYIYTVGRGLMMERGKTETLPVYAARVLDQLDWTITYDTRVRKQLRHVM